MKRPISICGSWQDGEPMPLRPGGFSGTALPILGALLFGLVAGLLAGRQPGNQPAALARGHVAAESLWQEREPALRQLLRVDPGNDRARFQLAGVLAGQALVEVQRAYPTERAATFADAEALEHLSALALRSCPRMAEALRLAEEVARHGRDGRLRALGWVRLARFHSLMGNPEEVTACQAAAGREEILLPTSGATASSRRPACEEGRLP